MKNKALSILGILIILGGAFYWFQLRPAQIRKECIKQYPNAFNDSKDSFGNNNQKTGYERCLRLHGLEK